jgi:hypothetical protein
LEEKLVQKEQERVEFSLLIYASKSPWRKLLTLFMFFFPLDLSAIFFCFLSSWKA